MEDSKFLPRLQSLQNILKTLPECTKEQREQLGELLATISPNCFSSNTRTPANIPVSKFPVTKLKKWDVVHMRVGAIPVPHYHIVLKVTKDKVYCLSVTSEKTPFADLEIKKSRQLKGYICNTITVVPTEQAKDKFVFIYDGSKKEITEIFGTIMSQLNSISLTISKIVRSWASIRSFPRKRCAKRTLCPSKTRKTAICSSLRLRLKNICMRSSTELLVDGFFDSSRTENDSKVKCRLLLHSSGSTSAVSTTTLVGS